MAWIPVSYTLVAAGDGDREALTILQTRLFLVEREARGMTYNDVRLIMAGTIAARFILIPFVQKATSQ